MSKHTKWYKGETAPKTEDGCWCSDYDIEYRAHKYWHRVSCILMYLLGFFGLPWIVAIVTVVIEKLFG